MTTGYERLTAFVLALFVFTLTACSENKALDEKLRALITAQQLDQPFAPDIETPSPLLAELGGQLFFSPDLSIDGSVACASCHHPEKAGTDGIALPVGIGAGDSSLVGQARLDAAREANPSQSLEGLIPRNSPSVFNAVLYRKRLFWDGRVQYQQSSAPGSAPRVIAGFGAAQHNPSNYLQENLLQTQARMPLTSSFEMKGGQKPDRNSHEIEQDILLFLQAQPHWCKAFARVFGLRPCDELITLNHLTRALAAFQATLIFTDSPFQRYIDGENDALSALQKRGAIAFLTDTDKGGAGCVHCHSGKTFTSERFYNINIPPSGRGANDNGWDLGRHNVDKTAARFSFRVPTLLNAAHTAPYFHNGIATTLEDAIRYKQTAADAKKPQHAVHLDDIDYPAVREAITEDFAKGAAKPLLPEKLSEQRIEALAAFIRSLSDDCVADADCSKQFVHERIASARKQKAERPALPAQTWRAARNPVLPSVNCQANTPAATNNGTGFSRHDLDTGLAHERHIGLIKKGWLIDVVNYASVAAVDLDYDCFDELLFDAGEQGLKLYYQQPDGTFVEQPLPLEKPEGAVNALPMDLDGDYRFDLFLGNYGAGPALVAFDFAKGAEDIAALTTLTGPVINASLGDINNDGYQDMVLGMWRSFSSFKQPHIWINDGQGNLTANEGFINLAQHEKQVGGNEQVKRQNRSALGVADLTFTPNLVDINNDGYQDLLLASDFFRSQVMKNASGRFQDITDKQVIDDTNGMGAAVGDFDNNGTMDWFVTSIVDQTAPGLTRGHRLYLNEGGGQYRQAAMVNKDVEWSWGACTADFNNDGYLDLFYISGYGEPLPTATYESDAQQDASEKFLRELDRYSQSRPTLLINN
ncbi:MAG: cytochrome c peroxidase, partial [Ketobacteraceae bacterium]|nr:cytochrome c peroxidase [Ketobacteraceae bacterium]